MTDAVTSRQPLYMDNFELQDNVQALQNIQSYDIPNEHDFQSESPAQLLEGEL